MRLAICNECGLTLIELCLTLLVLGLIVAAATPQFNRSYQDLKLKSEAERLVDDLRMIHRRAVLSGRPWRFRVWENGKGYELQQQSVQRSPDQPAWLWPGRWQVRVRHPLPDEFELNPNGTVLEWTPAGDVPHSVLDISGANGKKYEIQISQNKIALLPATPTQP
ncbi:MAG: Tfp pilus assembly protein FimT/FimU [bacterium]